MKIVNRSNLSAEALAALDAELPRASTLLGLLGLLGPLGLPGSLSGGQGTPLKFGGVVTQDEFTHDVVMSWRDGLWLVYGAT